MVLVYSIRTWTVVRLHTSEHELLKNVRNFMENHEFFVKLVDFMSIYTHFTTIPLIFWNFFDEVGILYQQVYGCNGACQGIFTKLAILLDILIEKIGSNMQIS